MNILIGLNLTWIVFEGQTAGHPSLAGTVRTVHLVVLCAKEFIRFVDRKNEERKFIENSRKIECSIFISNRVESRQDGRSAYETRVSAGSLGDGE